MSDHQSAQPTIDSEVVEILEDFAENLSSASEEDNFAQLNKVVTESVNEAKTAITNLIAQEANKAYEKGKSDKAWEQIEVSSDAINVAARLNELNRLENVKVSHPDLTSQLIAIMVYLKERRKELAQLTAEKGSNNG